MTGYGTLTLCRQVVTARRAETCIGCSGKSCSCCDGSGIHTDPSMIRNARKVIHYEFAESHAKRGGVPIPFDVKPIR